MPDPIDPCDWFLHYDPVTHDGNLVTPLIDGEVMMAEIYDQIINLGAGDFCFYGAWMLHPGQVLSSASPINIFDLFIDALGRGAEVRLILFRGQPSSGDVWNLLDYPSETHMSLQRSWLNLGNFGAEVIVDNKHPTEGSHHEKYAVFGKKQTSGGYVLTAFCGGIDLAPYRLDNGDHQTFAPPVAGWHDVHAKIEGPAAEKILDDFIARWKEHSLPASALKTVTTLFDKSTYTFVSVAGLETYSHQVEILNTYACEDDWGYYDFEGVVGYENICRTIEAAYKNAIAKAQHYIYLENCFFLYQPLVEELAKRLRDSDVTLILMLNYLGFGNVNLLERYYENAMLDILRAAAKPDQLYVCDLRPPEAGYNTSEPPVLFEDAGYTATILVHAKVMIVDDVYVTLGSANFNPRSMTMDSEINIGVLDTNQIQYSVDGKAFTVCQFARDFRVSLWKEHLQLTEDIFLLEIPTAIETWCERINRGAILGYESKAPSRVFDHDPRRQGIVTMPGVGLYFYFWNIAHVGMPNCDRPAPPDS